MANYCVDYTALASLKTSLSVQSNNWNCHLTRLQTRVNRLSQSNKISGSGADNIKLYMESMYGTLIDLFAKLITLHIENYLLYQRDYHFKVDPQTDALILETELTAVKEEVDAKKAGIAAIDGAVKYALNNVRDIFTFSYSGDELDKVNKAHYDLRKAIVNIDTNIKQIESTHSSSDFVNSGQLISVLKQFLAEAAGQGRDFKQGFSPDKLAGLSSYSALLEAKLAVEKELESKADEIEAAAQKDEFISRYEEAHPDIAEKLDVLLENVTEEHVREIKYYIYTVGEPYASIYLDQLNRYEVGNIAGLDTGYYWHVDNTINVDLLEEPQNPRGPYTTFFHESGHALDYNYQNDGSFYSETYRNAHGQSLMDVLYADVRADVTNTINSVTTDPTTRQHLLDYIMGAKSIPLSDLSPSEQGLLSAIQNYYKSDLAGALNEAPSDVYGGVTSNIIVGSYGHWNDNYWYDESGNPTNAQCRELWAEYYSYCMTGNTVAMANLKEHFPNASAFLDEMAASMAGGS